MIYYNVYIGGEILEGGRIPGVAGIQGFRLTRFFYPTHKSIADGL